MTVEEKAKQYVKNNTDESVNSFNGEQLQEAYIAGAKENGVVWHKVADGDLPKEFDKPYLCKVYGHFEVGYFMAYKEQPWHFDDYYLDSEDVIAWCEIPRYEGE